MSVETRPGTRWMPYLEPTEAEPVGAVPSGTGPVGAGPVGAGPVGAGPVGAGAAGAGPTEPGPTGEGSRARQTLTALVVPAERGRPVRSVHVEASTRGYSDIIGGGLLEEILLVVPGGGAVALYVDERRVQHGLPENTRAQRLASRLGLGAPLLPTLRGDVLITGLDRGGADTDVPAEVVTLVRRTGIRFRTR
ncbi:MAG: hypothetical protein P8Z68_05255 [Kineosporiaceae bacterium]